MLLFAFAFYDIITVLFLIMCIGERDIHAKRLYAIVAGCAELGQAALKVSRILREENPTPMRMDAARRNLAEESADVTSCLIELSRIFFDVDQCGDVRARKLIRWHNRLSEVAHK